MLTIEMLSVLLLAFSYHEPWLRKWWHGFGRQCL